MVTVMPAANMRATWLAPDRASVPKTYITTDNAATRTTKGISETHHEGCPPLLNLIIFY